MVIPVVLASGSSTRAQMLKNANVAFRVEIPGIDENSIKLSLLADGAPPRDIADTLAEMKARKISAKRPGAMVIGCDQVLDFGGELVSKPKSRRDAMSRLQAMRGKRHMLLSAAVICQDGQAIWRHVGQVRLRMNDVTDDYLTGYLERNWDRIRHSVGAYRLEEEGVRLFSAIDGDYFNVLGMPLLELLNFLATRGVIEQ